MEKLKKWEVSFSAMLESPGECAHLREKAIHNYPGIPKHCTSMLQCCYDRRRKLKCDTMSWAHTHVCSKSFSRH